MGDEAEKMGLEALSEIFADRAYMDDLSLVPRGMDGAMITDEDEAIRRCVKMIKEGKVTSVSGKELDIKEIRSASTVTGQRHWPLSAESETRLKQKVYK